MEKENKKQLDEELAELRIRLQEAEETISAIRGGEVDGIIFSGPQGEQVFTKTGAEQAYRLLIEAMNEGAVSLNQEGMILYCNHRFAEMVKTPLERVIGTPLRQFVRASDQPLFDALVKKGAQESGKGELVLIHNDGTVLPVLLSVSASQTAHVRSIVVTDLTAQKHIADELKRHREHLEELVKERTNELETSNQQLQKEIAERKQAVEERVNLQFQLNQAQKMEAIGTLAGGIAHDFNNILTAILGYSEFALFQLPEGSKAIEDIEQVIQSGKRATDLVKQILTFSRQGEQMHKPLQIDLVIKEALKLLRSSIPTTIDIQQHVVDCGLVMADPTQVHQIIMNLCTNAYHAMRETGGELDVSMEVVELTKQDYLDTLALQPGPHVKLSVCDTGCGMSKELQERIFEPYYTTKQQGEGTGMGLSVVHGIIKSHHGHITVYSEPGKGTEFHVYLPLVQAQDEGLAKEAGGEILPGSGTILVVDDEPTIGEMLKRMLNSLGYEVLLCSSSTEALEVFTQQRAHIALVLTDMTMPVMNGAELARRIKLLSPTMPVVLCTGFSAIMDEKKARRMGIDGYMMKPVILHKLAQTLHDILEKKSGSRPAG
ncbi:MAG: ATP-binding protein [Desulfobulbaceae bacterium]|jgi:PAS domain S-box-containing protein|nr:ATP-binding protein [Desulfobulbaceae bacterium]